VTGEDHPDLFNDAIQAATRDTVEFASIVTTLARGLTQHKARRDRLRSERSNQVRRAQQAQERAERAGARARWAPASDRAWLRDAGLLDLGTAWSAAVPYADPASDRFEHSAQTAVRNCEERLRKLHPYAMSHYDRLRSEGMGRVEAMTEALPLFTRAPHAHQQPASPRPALRPGNGLGHAWGAAVHGPSRVDFEAERQRYRGKQILDGMEARRRGGLPLTEDEQRAALESATNLPAERISEVLWRPPAPAPAQQLWKQDFPFPITEVLKAAAAARTHPARPKRVRQARSRDAVHQRRR
jgi:hypothetical protein